MASHWVKTLAWPFLLLAAGLHIGCTERPSTLAKVLARGELVVLTRNSPTTYFEGPDGPTGFEYDLALLFAQRLGVKLTMVTTESFSDIIPMVAQGKADFAAAGLSVTDRRKALVRFSPPYQQITPQVIYRAGHDKPSSIDDLAQSTLEVVAASSHAERLAKLKAKHPTLTWSENPELGSEDLLYLVWQQVIDYTVADSNEVALNQQFYPELRVAFDLGDPESLAWAFPKNTDNSLYKAARAFFKEIKKNGELDQLIERHYGHVQDFDYVGTRTYLRHIQQRLPELRDYFERAAKAYDLDWRLLAAIGYQESHWNPRATSPTGVRGIMMLTRTTARQLGIDNRMDPENSIFGGALYLKQLLEKIPDRIDEPDRTWLALAAYNIGFGHLEDARILTEKQGGDPDRWIDVKEKLPLLSQKQWYQHTRYGYARGREPVRYVENIRSYHDILVWYTEREKPPPVKEPEALKIISPVL